MARTLVYGVLCVAVGAFLFWMMRPAPAPKPELPPPTPAPAATPAPIVVSSNVPPPSPKVTPAPRPVPAQPTASVSATGTRPVATVLETQIALARLGLCPGSIDGVAGSQTRSALMAFQIKQGITPSGHLDAETKEALQITLPATTEYTVTSNDLARLMPVPKTWLEKSEQPRLDFETLAELLGEKAFSSPTLIRALNPSIDWTNCPAGTTVTIPRVEFPPASGHLALIKISLQGRVLEAFDDQSNLVVHFPCSIGRLAEKRPAGELHVIVVAMDPNYTFDPAVFPESPEAQSLGRKLIIPPGPNNPVGVAWIGLDRPGYGIHGTPAPEQVGRTESHGCFRLANWNADYLAHMVWVGMPVIVE